MPLDFLEEFEPPDYDEYETTGDVCPECGELMVWSQCWNGCDEGYFDGYEEDPMWYDPGDLVTCSACHGHGGFTYCPNSKNHAPQQINAGDTATPAQAEVPADAPPSA